MKVLDVELDNKPTPAKVMELAELRIRNLLCFKELQSFNDAGKWLSRHPLVTHQSEYGKLEELFLLDHTRFLDQYNNCRNNIQRYETYLRSDKRTDRRESDQLLLQKHTERRTIFETVMTNNKL